jgi:assimilatory nitrate reductase catalytic subunit
VATTIAQGERVSFWWTMGVNQGHEATRTAQAIIDVALMTGNLGRPGTGANSITGQCNAMGSRLFSNTTSLFAGRSFTDAEDRREVAELLGIDVARVPDQPSLAYDQIVEGVASGRIKGLWVIATNTAHSWIDQDQLRAAFADLEFLVVQDMYSTTETAQLAHLVLPAAGWGEKEGTFINSERRVGVVKRVSAAPGHALADFTIVRLLADAWGCGEMFAEWTDPEAVWSILTRLSRGRPCDVSGIDGYDTIDRAGGVQWPCPEGSTIVVADERRLFGDGRFFHADGKARFVFADPTPLPEATSAEFPLVLLTGRGSSSQWHTQTRTSKSAVLRALEDDALSVEISPEDARARSVCDGDWIEIASARGVIHAEARVTPAVSSGQVFVSMHDASTNRLTMAAFDPYSRQPAYKSAAVEVRPARRRHR